MPQALSIAEMIMPDDPKQGYFLCLRRDQLGARLLMMLNCIRLSQDYGFDYLVNWFPRGGAAPKLANPQELFSQGYMDRHFVANDRYEVMREAALPLHAFFDDKTPDRLVAHLKAGNHVLLEEGFEIPVFAWEDATAIADRYRGFIAQIGLNPLVAEKIIQIKAVIGDDPAGSVSYHVRRGDILNEDPWRHGMWPAKIEPDELYLKHLEIAQPQTALVFSDLAECITRLQSEHPQVRGIAALIDTADCTVSQQDFLELYAMSRTDKIVAPVISAFSSAAARLSGRDRLRFVDELTPDQIDAAYDRVADRFQGGLDNFANVSEAAHIFSRLSRHLAMNDREAESYKVGQMLIAADADNAFVPLLHAVNCIYLSKWDEAQVNIDHALSAPGLWNESHATALALASHIAGALGDAIGARRLWLRAFWAKPHLPDVIIAGSAMLERHRLRDGPDLPFDAALLTARRQAYMNRDVMTVQRKLLNQKAVDFAVLMIEWHPMILDRRAQRLLSDKRQLQLILQDFETMEGNIGSTSFQGLLLGHLGQKKAALDRTSQAYRQAPTDFLIAKRHAEVLVLAGKAGQACKIMTDVMDHAAHNPFAHFVYATCLEAGGKNAKALAHFEQAATLDACTPAIHAALAERLMSEGKKSRAGAALETAHMLAPRFQKFENQRQRLIGKGR